MPKNKYGVIPLHECPKFVNRVLLKAVAERKIGDFQNLMTLEILGHDSNRILLSVRQGYYISDSYLKITTKTILINEGEALQVRDIDPKQLVRSQASDYALSLISQKEDEPCAR